MLISMTLLVACYIVVVPATIPELCFDLQFNITIRNQAEYIVPLAVGRVNIFFEPSELSWW